MRAFSAESRLSARPARRAAALVILTLPLLDRAALAAVLERVRADLWLTDLQLGLAAGLPAAIAALLAFRRPLAAPGRLRRASGALLWGAAAALAGAARGAWTLFAARLVAGGAAGAGRRAALVVEGGVAVRPPLRDAALIVPAMTLAALGYAGAGALGWRLGWRAALVAAGAASVVLTLAAAWLARREPGAALAPVAARAAADRAYASRPAIAGGALVAFAAAALATWAPAFLERARGVPRAIAPLEIAAAALMAGVAAAWARPTLAKTLRDPRWLCSGAALASAPLALAALLARQPGVYLAALVAALALALVALATLRDALALDAPRDGSAAASAALPWVALLGDAPAALLVGLASHATSLWWAMLAVPAALLAGGALLALVARRPREPSG
ncbi:hypothetical protein [Anaeromyxobacter sp. Fw109-5]|uniref:hypothetical protein n=1 Tax=Anaeromyxobacter sp. (strain Fw109-5) TaxID=404589 RepID=UPI000158A7B2|nr:hypothetical protein [Anaeromyxobacter sp. Fw109-5]ABS24647.1 major facilitator superfamily transporter [Anaeromyxobacter sp. Fw109-5]